MRKIVTWEGIQVSALRSQMMNNERKSQNFFVS